MATFKILDTGYVYYANVAGQTQLLDSQRAGYTGSGVTSFTLLSASDSMGQGVNVDNPTTINSSGTNNTVLSSIANMVFKVSFIVHKTIVTSGFDINNIVQLNRLQKTHGLKLLYLSSNESVAGKHSLIEAFGEQNVGGEFSAGSPADDDGTVSTTTKYLVGRVSGLTLMNAAAGTYWKGSFDFIVTDGN